MKLRSISLLFLCLLSLSAFGQQGQMLDREQVDRSVFNITPRFNILPSVPGSKGIRPGDVVNVMSSDPKIFYNLWEWDGEEWRPWVSGLVAGTTIENVTFINIYLGDEYFNNNYYTKNLFKILIEITQVLKEPDYPWREDLLSGAINGVNRVFHTPLEIYNKNIKVSIYYEENNYKGEIEKGTDYTITGPNQVTFRSPPISIDPYTGEAISARIYAFYQTIRR